MRREGAGGEAAGMVDMGKTHNPLWMVGFASGNSLCFFLRITPINGF